MGLADLHIHTIYSYDGTASVAAVLNRARQAGLDVITVTDHDEIAGSLMAMELAPARDYASITAGSMNAPTCAANPIPGSAAMHRPASPNAAPT